MENKKYKSYITETKDGKLTLNVSIPEDEFNRLLLQKGEQPTGMFKVNIRRIKTE
jgi:hypothetical protein